MSDVEQGVPVCPACGREVQEGAVACECGHVFFDDSVEDTAKMPPPPEPQEDPLADWADSEDLEDGPWEEMTDEPDEQAAGAREERHERSWVKFTVIVVIVLVNVAVIAAIIYLLRQPRPPADNGGQNAARRVPRKGDPATALVAYTTEAGTLERAVEDALLQRELNCPIRSINAESDSVTVTLKKEAVWDMAQLREHAEADALKVLKGVLAATDDAVGTIRIQLEARMGGETGTEWETAFQLECTRAKAAAVARMRNPRAAAAAAGAKMHKRLIEGE